MILKQNSAVTPQARAHDFLKAYVAAGFAVTPLQGKIPGKGWQNTVFRPNIDPDRFPGNFGIVLQNEDLVIDIDPRNYKEGDKPVKRLCEKLGLDLKKTAVVVQTGGGGWHLYYKKPADLFVAETLPEYPGLEFKSKGRQVVGAGGIHPETGKTYELVSGDFKSIAPAPKELLELIKREGRKDFRKASPEKKAVYSDDEQAVERYREFLLTAPLAVEGENGDKTTYTVACKGKTLGLSPEKAFEMLEKFYNPLCSPPWNAADLWHKVQNAYSYSQQIVGADSPANDFGIVETGDKPAPGGKLHWDFTDNGQKKKTLNNACNFFWLPDSPLNSLLAYNEFTEQCTLVKRAPWHKDDQIVPADGKAWTDEDTIMCRYFLSKEKGFDVSVNIVEEAAIVVSKRSPNHPVRNYLNSIHWDGVPRLDTWLHDFCGVKDDNYSRAVASKTLMGAVARVFEPGAKFDYMLVLEGKQGSGKSSVVACLGGHWYGDITIDPHNKDTVTAMLGKWVCEASEMEFTTRAEAQALKAFLTRQVDHIRAAYARHVRAYPRQCIFIGTMNLEAEPGYLKDSTGNRRFWPVLTHNINIPGLRDVRDQLFAEAKERYFRGESLFIEDEAAVDQALAEQHARRQVDPWLERVADWLERDEFDKRRDIVTGMEIWTKCLMGMEKNITRREQCRIANIMQHELGWTKGVYHHPDLKKTVNGYKRPE